jgi:very-short-patch-repair endonuclease
VIIGPYTVDFLWPEAGLIVEVDGWRDHGTRSAFESDRERDAWLTAQGYRVVRFTWRQVKYDGTKVARVVRAILAS